MGGKIDYAKVLAESTQKYLDRQTKQRRIFLSEEQLDVLEHHFQSREDWSVHLMDVLSQRLSISRTKVYKWKWERKKKQVKEAKEGENMVIENHHESDKNHLVSDQS